MTLPGPLKASVLLFDLESNGLLDELTLIHCLVIKDLSTGISSRYNDQPIPANKAGSIEDGVKRLQGATSNGQVIAGHNVIKFDVAALQKLYPWFKPDPELVLDTLVMARLIYPDLIDLDTKLMKRKKDPLPKGLFKRHSLEAWGHRLGVLKDDYSGDPAVVAKLVSMGMPEEEAKKVAYNSRWVEWNQTMEDYCVQDVEATEAVWNKMLSKVEGPQFVPSKGHPEGFSWLSVEIEHAVAHIIAKQERHGFGFDREGAAKLYSELVKEKLNIEAEIKTVFKPRYFKVGAPKTPSVSRRDQEEALGLNLKRPIYEGKGKSRYVTGYCFKSYDFTEGAPYQPVKLVEFNPGSRDHIAIWLKKLHGWDPVDFTNDGKPKVDETVLSSLPYPEAKVFNLYLTIGKRLGQLSEGKESWLRHEKSGRIHGQMVTNGAVTGRGTHSNPNLGQVPAVKKNKLGVLMGLAGGWGYECRALFRPVTPGMVQVGIDMSGIELRCLGHYMARFDGGAYGRVVVDGDVHSENQRAAELATRDLAKTFIYAFLYGAGDAKIGSIVGRDAKAGGVLKARFLKNLPALSKLIEAVQKAAKRGYLKGLDGRLIAVRHKHAALNTLLQSAGAILSKQWQVFFHKALKEAGLEGQVHQMAWVHDEIQIECPPELAERVGQMAVQAIKDTGEFFGFRAPITGEYKVGRNWAETH